MLQEGVARLSCKKVCGINSMIYSLDPQVIIILLYATAMSNAVCPEHHLYKRNKYS